MSVNAEHPLHCFKGVIAWLAFGGKKGGNKLAPSIYYTAQTKTCLQKDESDTFFCQICD